MENRIMSYGAASDALTIGGPFRAESRHGPVPHRLLPTTTQEFRQDINGLRAYAVAAVLLYHFAVPGFGGGFSGVDVFFVISGYLMTSIILSRLQQGTFSLPEFYISRARRIVPALSVLCISLLAIGYFWLTPSDYQTLGEHCASAMTFVSNFVFKGEEGYFDAPMRDKWMLHTWSLSVEWQFYMLYPLALMALLRGRVSQNTVVVLGAACVASLAASIAMTAGKPAFAFYLLPCRIWEFMAGALACMLLPAANLPQLTARLLEALGFILIVSGNALFSEDTGWPGGLAVLPVAGALLVLASRRPKSFLTGNVVAQALGRWSYSIYLWHWPIYVALGYFAISGRLATSMAIGASIAAGAMSYALIEQPFRRMRFRQIIALLALIGLPFVAGLIIYLHDGLSNRVSETIRRIDFASEDKYHRTDCGYDKHTGSLKRCRVGTGGDLRFILWGDSHAGAVASAVAEASGGAGLIYSTTCPTIFNAYPKVKPKNICTGFNDAVLTDIGTLPPDLPVIVANRFSFYLLGLNEGIKRQHGLAYDDTPNDIVLQDEAGVFERHLAGSLCRIAASRKVYVVRPIPEMGRNVPKTLSRAMMAGRNPEDISIPIDEYATRHRIVLRALARAEKECGITQLDPVPLLCHEGRCFGSIDKHPLYFDDDHLNEWGNKKLVSMFGEVFARAHK
jgi:peptidoglycan/LPS O-acetylase OafA/YrhL